MTDRLDPDVKGQLKGMVAVTSLPVVLDALAEVCVDFSDIEDDVLNNVWQQRALRIKELAELINKGE